MPNPSTLQQAIVDREAPQIRAALQAMDVFVLSVAGAEDGEQVPAMTTDVGGFEALVAFTSEQSAARFVTQRPELFGDDEGVDGVAVEGATLLESLPEGFGLWLDPESDESGIIDPTLTAQMATERA